MRLILTPLPFYSTSVWVEEGERWHREWPLREAGDTKRGTLVGIDRYGNKYFENLEEELPRMFSAG